MKPILSIFLSIAIAVTASHFLFKVTREKDIECDPLTYNHLSTIFLDSTPYDFVILGASKACYGINPIIIDSICGTNAYNIAQVGSKLRDLKLQLDGYLLCHPSPKTVLLTIDLRDFSHPDELYWYPQYYYYLNNSCVYSNLLECGYRPYMVKALPFLEMIHWDDYLREYAARPLLGVCDDDMGPGDMAGKGFRTLTTKRIPENTRMTIKEKVILDKKCVGFLEKMIDTCKQRNIRMIFLYSPEYRYQRENACLGSDSVFAFITQTAKANGIKYLRHDNLALCNNPDYFGDIDHLNAFGSTVYSTILAKELDTLLHPSKN